MEAKLNRENTAWRHDNVEMSSSFYLKLYFVNRE